MGLAKGRGRGGISKPKNRMPGGKPPPLMGRLAPPPGMVMRPRGPIVPPLVPRMRPGMPPPLGMRSPRLLPPPPMPPVLGGPRPPLPPFHPPPHGRLLPPPVPLRPPVPPPSLLRARGQGMPPPLGMRGPGFRPPGPPMLMKFGPGKRNLGPQRNSKKKQKGKKIDSGDEEINKPWVTDAMKNEIQKKHKLYQKAKKSNQQSDWDEFKEQRNRVTTMIREAKLEYIGSHPEEVGDFYCETCDWQFNLLTDMKSHVERHQTCGLEGCTFTADEKVLAKHIEVQHLSGIFKRIASLDSPEDIKNWIAERKRRYPTRENIERRRAEQEEKLKRGERLRKDPNLFNKDSRRKQPVHFKTTTVPVENPEVDERNQKRKCQNNDSEEGNSDSDDSDDSNDSRGCVNFHFYNQEDHSEDEEDELCRSGVLRFFGTRYYADDDCEENNDGEGGKYSDDEWDCITADCPVPDSVPTVSKVLCNLMTSYGSDSCGSDDEPPLEVPIQKEREHLSSALSVAPNKISTSSSSIDRTREESKQDGNLRGCSLSKESVPIETLPREDIEYRSKNVMQDNAENSLSNGLVAGRPKENVPIDDCGNKIQRARIRHRQRPKTLLEKLLEREIRHERNVILQCIRFIVEKSFFESKNTLSSPENKDNSKSELDHQHTLNVLIQSSKFIVKKNFFDVEESKET